MATDNHKPDNTPAVVSFAGYSGSGKTTLVEKVIKILTDRGYKVGAVKHDGHRFDIDKPGKDSWRMTQAGAAVTVITDSDKLAMIRKHEQTPSPEEVISNYFAEMDIVIIEGWKESAPNRIEVHRKGTGKGALCLEDGNSDFIAVACDCNLETTLPRLDIDDPHAVVDFIITSYL